MKKILLSLLSVFSLTAAAQTATLARTYSLTNMVPAGITVKSIVYGNNLFYIYSEGGPTGLTVQKNNLDGVPALKRSIQGLVPQSANAFFVNATQGKLYISGHRTTSTTVQPFIVRIDTALCIPDFIKDYNVAGFTMVRINDAEITSDSNLVLAGSATNTGSMTTERGFVLGTKLSTNCTPVYSNTMTVMANSVTSINSIKEISAATLLYSAQSGTATYLGRISKTANSLTFPAGSYSISFGGGSIETYSNLKKVLVHNQNSILKIDTNLTLINGTQSAAGVSNALYSFYLDNKIYRPSSVAKMEIVDTNFTAISNTYSTIVPAGASFASAVTKNANNLFITYSEWATTAAFYTIKTNTLGTMNCSSQLSVNITPTTVTGIINNMVSGGVVTTPTSVALVSSVTAVSHTIQCTSVGVSENSSQYLAKLRSNDGVYNVVITQNIASVQVYDINGRMILNLKFDGNSNMVEIDLRKFEHSVYIGRIIDVDGREMKAKLLN